MDSTENQTIKTFSDNPLWNLAINVFLPVFLLKKLPGLFPHLNPLAVLLIALSFPLFAGLWDYAKAKKKNYVSILGLVNTGLTGGLAVLEVEGFWFAVKEGILPLILGLYVLLSLRLKKNFVEAALLQPQIFNLPLIEERSQAMGQSEVIKKITQIGTFWFSLSFFTSAALNFALALYIFKAIDPLLEAEKRAQILNEQIAEMTWMGYIVIALPLALGTGFLLWWLLKALSNSLNLKMEEILHSHKAS
ncbi:MAG TPA: hypothetical protein DCL41_07515 [Bdellovibrionales bacterium]|nr:hypothetical protein [Pseudobdellovibrionaceae bacterium]HAG91703.1 hypothetical protein [Bdellovibrionales bacterium]